MSDPEVKRTLGLFDTTMLVAGSMIGSGIFIVTSQMSLELGSSGWLILCWVLTGIITVFAALSYGELAGMMPNVGGQYIYIKRAYNKLIAFLYGWTVFTVIQTGVIAAVAVAFAKYTGLFIPFFSEDNILFSIGSFKINHSQILALMLIAFLTWINTRGIKSGKLIQRVFTSAKLLALFGLIIIGIAWGWGGEIFTKNFTNPFDANATELIRDSTGNVTGAKDPSPLSGFALVTAIGVALIGSLFSADSWNNVTFIAAEIKDPKKNIPMGLFLGTCIVTALYVLANVAYLCLLPLKGSFDAQTVYDHGIQFADKERVGAATLGSVFGSTAQLMMAGLIMVSTFGCNNGIILAGSRLFQSMAKDGLFFKQAAHLNKNAVPAKSLIIQGLWASVLCLSGSYGDLLGYTTFASLVFYLVTITGVFILRKKEPDTERPYKAFGYPVIPALYLLITFAICIDLLYYKPVSSGIGLGIVALGIPVYFLTQKKTEQSGN